MDLMRTHTRARQYTAGSYNLEENEWNVSSTPPPPPPKKKKINDILVFVRLNRYFRKGIVFILSKIIVSLTNFCLVFKAWEPQEN